MSVFVVAEIGVAWNGDRRRFADFIGAAKRAGADAVKGQLYDTDRLVARRGITDPDLIGLLKRCELTDDDLRTFAIIAERAGLKHFWSVFDPRVVYRAVDHGAHCLKVGNAEADWDELVNVCVATGLPTYVSVGKKRPKRALGWRAVHCPGEYPAAKLPAWNQCTHGYSSHHADWADAAWAAKHIQDGGYLEAHIKLDDRDPEAQWSINEADFRKLVGSIR